MPQTTAPAPSRSVTSSAARSAEPEALNGLILKPGDRLAVPGIPEGAIARVTQTSPNRHLIELDNGEHAFTVINAATRPSDLLGGVTLKLFDTIESPAFETRVLGGVDRIRLGRYRLRLERKHQPRIIVEVLTEPRAR